MSRRAALYLRISKDWKQDSAGVDRQRDDAVKLLATRGWELHAEYVDNDISASGRRRRPGYRDLLRSIEAGEVDVVVARSFERLCKSKLEQLELTELIRDKQVTLAFTHAPDVDCSTAVGRMMADQMAAYGRFEFEQKSERHQDQIAQAARQGRMVGGRRAFGYTADGLELDPVEASVLRQMYDRWLTGESMSSIAAWLNGTGFTTPQGRRWRFQTVREVLANPRNAGLRGMRDVVNRKTGTRSQWHRIIGPAVWPAIVAEETWRAAVDRVKDPDRPGAHVGSSAQRWLLTGIALCGECDRPLVSGHREGVRLLRCPSLRHVSRRADLIEDFVEEILMARLRTAAYRTLLLDDAGERVDVEALRSEAISMRARLEGLAADYADGVLDRAGVKVAGDRLRKRLADVEDRIARAGRVDVVAPLRAAADVETVWEDYPLATRREVIRRLMRVRVLRGRPGRPGGVRFQPDTVSIEWNTTPG